VLTLNLPQAEQLCDWLNQAQGGYGRVADCGALDPVATNSTLSECVSGLPVLMYLCPGLTVGQLEDCTLAQGTNLCRYDTIAACAPLRICEGPP
jgi:hypothetical protein